MRRSGSPQCRSSLFFGQTWETSCLICLFDVYHCRIVSIASAMILEDQNNFACVGPSQVGNAIIPRGSLGLQG